VGVAATVGWPVGKAEKTVRSSLYGLRVASSRLWWSAFVLGQAVGASDKKRRPESRRAQGSAASRRGTNWRWRCSRDGPLLPHSWVTGGRRDGSFDRIFAGNAAGAATRATCDDVPSHTRRCAISKRGAALIVGRGTILKVLSCASGCWAAVPVQRRVPGRRSRYEPVRNGPLVVAASHEAARGGQEHRRRADGGGLGGVPRAAGGRDVQTRFKCLRARARKTPWADLTVVFMGSIASSTACSVAREKRCAYSG